jgi:hypothetical protein
MNYYYCTGEDVDISIQKMDKKYKYAKNIPGSNNL